MQSKILALSMLLALGLTSSPLQAQLPAVKPVRQPNQAAQQQYERQYPLLARVRHSASSVNPLPSMSLSAVPNAAHVGTGDGREIYGVLLNRSGNSYSWDKGMYKFTATTTPELTLVGRDLWMVPTAGGSFQNGNFYIIKYDDTYASYGDTFIQYTWEGWELPKEDVSTNWTDYRMLTGVNDGNLDRSTKSYLMAKETAIDAEGRVWGEFYTNDKQHLEIGQIDYTQLTRTTSGTCDKEFVALGITKAGQMYGVATDGNLYKVDKLSGKTTLVGPTGVTVLGSDGKYSQQSGEIDKCDDTFFWAAIDGNGNSGLYTVDLNTGAASLIGNFANNEQIACMYIPQPAAEDGAPAKVSDLSATFENGSLTGTVNFTVPTTTFSGGTLFGDVSYFITCGDDTVATGTTTPGATEHVSVTVGEGSQTFTVVLQNAAGKSEPESVETFVGFGIPDEATNINLSATGNNAVVSWKAPTRTTDGGYLGQLKYNVVRYPDEQQVATGITDTSFTESLDGKGLGMYSYGVTVDNNGKLSQERRTSSLMLGDALEVPYSEDFSDYSTWNLFTVIDANNNHSTWIWQQGEARASYQFGSGANDWLITPPINLTAGQRYLLSFNVRAAYSDSPERIAVALGTSNTAAAMTNIIVDTTTVSSTSYITLQAEFIPTESGRHFIGFHDISRSNGWMMGLTKISLTQGASDGAPDSLSAFSAEAGEHGAMSATLSFSVPQNDLNGHQLHSVDGVIIERDGVQIADIKNLTPGQHSTYTDNNITKDGNAIYSAYAYNSAGNGRIVKDTVYVGIGKPRNPEHVNATDRQTSFVISSDTVSTAGLEGGYVDPATTQYVLFRMNQRELYDTVAVQTGNPEFVFDQATDQGQQSLLKFYMQTRNKMGESRIIAAPALLLGAPVQLPFKESFAGSTVSTYMWTSQQLSMYQFGTTPDLSSDGDGGSAIYLSGYSEWASLNTPKIAFGNAIKPTLVYDYYVTAGAPATLKLQVQLPDGTTTDIAGHEFHYADSTTGGWHHDFVDLSAYKSERYVILKFFTVADQNNVPLAIDNINVLDIKDHDLSAALSAPAKATRGKATDIEVKVTNEGLQPASGYRIVITDHDNLVVADSTVADKPLASFDNRTLRFAYKPTVLKDWDNGRLKATVTLDGDVNASNNSANAIVKLSNPDVPAPTGLEANENGSTKNIDLQWTAIPSDPVQATDGFENYEAGATDFGRWTTINDNYEGSVAYALVRGYTYPSQGTDFAFTIFNPSKVTTTTGDDFMTTYPGFEAHTGSQYAAAIYHAYFMGESAGLPASNDWLVTPKLSGRAQTLSFWARNYTLSDAEGTVLPYGETFDVMTSTSGNSEADFTQTLVHDTLTSGTWTKVDVEVPAGVNYLAIHHNTPQEVGLILMIDDVNYELAAIVPEYYNIYRNDELVGTSADSTFTDNSDDTHSTYYVTAVYADGTESLPVSASVTTGITEIATDKAPVRVYSLDGILVRDHTTSLKGLQPGVYIVGNKRVVVR